MDPTTYETTTMMNNSTFKQDGWYKSHIFKINCLNLGGIIRSQDSQSSVGMARHEDDLTISLSLGSSPNFVVVTGESGSGKSMLISTSLSLILGRKKISSIIPNTSTDAKVEVIMKLSEPHTSIVLKKFKEHGLDKTLLPVSDIDHMALLNLSRDFSTTERSKHVKSTCTVNGCVVPLRTLRSISSVLIAVIDAPTASAALSSQEKRTKIIDIGVSKLYPDLIQHVVDSRNQYRKDRQKRQLIQKALEDRILPNTVLSTDSSEKINLLNHFVDELDRFENRIHCFRDKCKNAPYSDIYSAISQGSQHISKKSLKNTYSAFISSSWFDVSQEDKQLSVLYTNLIGMREALKELDTRIAAAQSVCDVTSLSSKQSMFMALEAARRSLYDAGEQEVSDDIVSKSLEQSHELLNELEHVLQKCKRFFEDDRHGPIATLMNVKSSFYASVEDIDLLITDWGVLSRKHGVPPYLLPSCHLSLRRELDGDIEKSILLPQARKAEEFSLSNFEEASNKLSKARSEVCNHLSKRVSNYFPSLDMEERIFVSRLNKGIRKCSEAITGYIGTDSVDFLLINKNQLEKGDLSSIPDMNDNCYELLDVVGSSGEKARVLLCIETSIPGSIGACIVDHNSFSERIEGSTNEGDSVKPLVAVLYDEIDAHVGGRALMSMGKMLLEQTRGSFSSSVYSKTQVITITHSPSLAALADVHLLVSKVKGNTSKSSDLTEVTVTSIEGDRRTKELARMASGDVAVDEAEIFAKALLRDRIKFEEDSEVPL